MRTLPEILQNPARSWTALRGCLACLAGKGTSHKGVQRKWLRERRGRASRRGKRRLINHWEGGKREGKDQGQAKGEKRMVSLHPTSLVDPQ